MNHFIATILFISLVNISCNSGSGKRNADKRDVSLTNQDGFLLVTKVVDGDTFWVYDGSSKVLKIRLIGVDAPESRKTVRKEVGLFGKEAKIYLTNLLIGKNVRLKYDLIRKDQYGRTLAYVYLKDGTFVNAELVKNGFAMALTVPPNVEFAAEFVKLQAEARENNRGLWKQ